MTHPDDIAVDSFAAVMKEKLAKKRAEGRGGWDDPAQCTTDELALYLINHVAKGDPVDVANLAMMLFHRGGSSLRSMAGTYMRTTSTGYGFPDEWRSIDTAPKDQSILVSEGVIVGEARYWEDQEQWLWANVDPGDHFAAPIYPTHWIPLPAAYSQSDAAGAAGK